MLQRIGGDSGSRLPSFLSTHPDPGDRVNTTTALAQKAAQGKSNLVVNGPGYVRRLDGLAFGDDPRQGYFAGDVLYHPAMRFQMTLPAGWKHQNSRAAVASQEPAQKAVMQLSLANAGTLSPEAFAQKLVTAGKVAGAQGKTETIGGAPAWVGHISIPQENAAAVVMTAGWIRRADTLMFQVLGRSAQAGDANDAKILASLRSFRALTDPARLSPRPDRVKVEKVVATATLEATLRRLGAAEAQLQADALLNNLEPDETVMAGTLLKLVVPGRR
jgi:predicted Zn-dependent protease